MAAYSDETTAYAILRGVNPADLPLICNGCSGGLSWLYGLGGKSISCEECCNRHDIDYQLGGSGADRKAADKRLRTCAGRAPHLPRWERQTTEPETWRQAMEDAVRIFWEAVCLLGRCLWWPVCRAWRWARSWIVWTAVRVFGRWYWAGE